jgi:tetratricopeptide (TPR) repeat protein
MKMKLHLLTPVFPASLAVLLMLAMLPSSAQEVRPPVRDQNRSGAPQTARRGGDSSDADRVAEQAQAAEAFEKGMAALEANQSEEAVTSFAKAVELAPDNIASRFYLAQALAMSGKGEAAVEQYEKLTEMQPDVAEIRLNYAQVLNGLERHPEAVAQWTRALALKPGDKTILFQLAYAELRAELPEQARPRFEELVQKDPDDADHHYGLGQSAFLTNDLETAESSFRKAAEIDPRYRNGLLAIAEAWREAGNLEKAAALLQEFPENSDATRLAGELLVELGKAEEALPSLESAVESAPTFANRQNLALAYLRAGKSDRAIETLADAVRTEPSNPKAHVALGRLLRDSRKFPEAGASFVEALKLAPDDVAAWNELAGVAMLAGNLPATLAAIDEIEKRSPLSAGHHYLRAIAHDRMQNDELAIAAYELFLGSSGGQNEDEEFKARQRLRMLNNKKRR